MVVEPVKGLRAYASYAEGYTIADVGRILRAINTNGVDVDNYPRPRAGGVQQPRDRPRVEARAGSTASASYWWSSRKIGSLLVRNPDGIFDVVRARIEIQGLDAQRSTPGCRSKG